MNLKMQKGFTLIELLVVIAIIGILAGILFVAINPKEQTDKATEKKALSQLSSVRTQAGIVSSDTNDFSFSEVKNNAKILKLVDDVESNEDSWAASIDLPDGTKACSDSSGYFGTEKVVIEMAFGKYFCSEGEPDGEEEEEDDNCSDNECCNTYDNNEDGCSEHGCEFDSEEEEGGGDCHI